MPNCSPDVAGTERLFKPSSDLGTRDIEYSLTRRVGHSTEISKDPLYQFLFRPARWKLYDSVLDLTDPYLHANLTGYRLAPQVSFLNNIYLYLDKDCT